MSKPVAFNEDGARRVIAATKAYEGGGRNMSPVKFRNVSDESPIRIGKTTAAWAKGASATITIWESGSAGSETANSPAVTVTAWNKFAAVASGKWVALAAGPFGAWYLIAAEC